MTEEQRVKSKSYAEQLTQRIKAVKAEFDDLSQFNIAKKSELGEELFRLQSELNDLLVAAM